MGVVNEASGPISVTNECCPPKITRIFLVTFVMFYLEKLMETSVLVTV